MTNTTWEKNGVTRLAGTPAQEVALKFEGFRKVEASNTLESETSQAASTEVAAPDQTGDFEGTFGPFDDSDSEDQ